MDICITPKKLYGNINAIPSKSQAHRMLICAAFSDQPTTLICPETNRDIEATANCLTALGAGITWLSNGYRVKPIEEVPFRASLPCQDSGSTLRFLLPIAGAGIDIDELMQGAADGREKFGKLSPDNDAYRYAMTRNILYRKGKSVETLACFEPDFTMMNEWYKQLFGESEGKDQKGLMPTSCIFSSDLHSMGQFLQDGARIMFETYVDVKHTRDDFYIEELEGNFDGLNFLANQNMSVVNRKAMEGTILAHTEGGVPLGLIEVDSLSAHDVGELIYFFWRACAVSGYLLSVNPFDQPGVESYKKNMFALLGKPGYEDRKAELEAALKD